MERWIKSMLRNVPKVLEDLLKSAEKITHCLSGLKILASS